MKDPIASFEIVGVLATGEQLKIAAKIGRPYRVAGGGPGEWACPVQLLPLYSELADIRGVDSFHAMWLAGSLIVKLLGHFKSEGGRLLNEDGTEFPLEAYSSGL